MTSIAPRPTPDRPDSAPPLSATPTLRLGPREYAIIMGVWLFLTFVAIAGRFLDPRIPGLPAPVTAAVVRATLVEYAIWMLLTPPLLWFASWLTDEERDRLWSAVLALVIGIAIAILVDALLVTLREALLPAGRRRRRAAQIFGPFSFARPGGLRFLDDLMIYFAVLFAGVARASMVRANIRQREAAALAEHASQLQVQLADARLGALRAQLDPHFLFNTLNAISALVERDPRGVRRMISRLSELLRHSLENDVDEVTLEQELAMLDRYLDIMRVRFGDRLRVAVDVAGDARDAMVPNLILQPLVENAIKYGVTPRAEGGEVAIRAHREGDRLILQVCDDGPGPGGGQSVAGGGVGLANARARLGELYGERQHLTLQPRGDGTGAVAEVSIPFRTGAS